MTSGDAKMLRLQIRAASSSCLTHSPIVAAASRRAPLPDRAEMITGKPRRDATATECLCELIGMAAGRRGDRAAGIGQAARFVS